MSNVVLGGIDGTVGGDVIVVDNFCDGEGEEECGGGIGAKLGGGGSAGGFGRVFISDLSLNQTYVVLKLKIVLIKNFLSFKNEQKNITEN